MSSHMEDAWEKQFQAGENERAELYEMLTWAYSKLHHVEFFKLEDTLMLDKIKLYIMESRTKPTDPGYSERFPEAYRCKTEGHIQGPDWGCSVNGVADNWCLRCDQIHQVRFERLPKEAQKMIIDTFIPKD